MANVLLGVTGSVAALKAPILYERLKALGHQVKVVATNARSVTLPNTSHWVMEESPQATMDALMAFLNPSVATTTASSVSSQPTTPASRSTLAQMRLTPDEVRANQTGTEQVGSSFLAGVSTKVLGGDPSKPGFYTIILSVPANTTIPAHSHRDDRMATVVSGTWQFGYGDRFDENALKRLPPGSVYSEPGGGNHFARTGAEPVLVQITGVGPTDTRYVNPSDTPIRGIRDEDIARAISHGPYWVRLSGYCWSAIAGKAEPAIACDRADDACRRGHFAQAAVRVVRD